MLGNVTQTTEDRLDDDTRRRILDQLASWNRTRKGGRLRVVIGGGLGDCLAHTPFLRHFRALGIYRQICGICPRRALEIFERNPHLDNLIACGDEDLARWSIADSEGDVFSPYFHVEAGEMGPTGLRLSGFHGWLRNDSRADQPIIRQIAGDHGIELADESMEIYPSPQDHKCADILLGPASGAPIVVIDTRDSSPFKDLPAALWQAVATLLQPHAMVVEQAQQPVLNAVRTLSPLPPVRVSAAIYRRARCVVGADSFPIHLATAVGTPCVAVFGPSDPRKFGHAGNHNLRSNVCPPCFQPSEHGCHRPSCLDNITPNLIVDAVRDILARRPHTAGVALAP